MDGGANDLRWQSGPHLPPQLRGEYRRYGHRDRIARAARPAAIFVLSDASDDAVSQPPVRWVVEELKSALEAAGYAVRLRHNLDEIHREGERIAIAPGSSQVARQVAEQAHVRLPSAAESLALAAGQVRNEPVLPGSWCRCPATGWP